MLNRREKRTEGNSKWKIEESLLTDTQGSTEKETKIGRTLTDLKNLKIQLQTMF